MLVSILRYYVKSQVKKREKDPYDIKMNDFFDEKKSKTIFILNYSQKLKKALDIFIII